MHLITSYAPPTFMKPCLVISTLYTDSTKETAIAFVNSLNASHAIEMIYQKDDYAKKNRTDFIPIKKHKRLNNAIKYHINLAKQMRNGCGSKIWEKGYNPYLKIQRKYCPKSLSKI